MRRLGRGGGGGSTNVANINDPYPAIRKFYTERRKST